MENFDQIRSCPLCGNKDAADAYLSSKDMLVSGQFFHMKQCKTCKLVYTNPRPKGHVISYYYQSDTYISHSDTAHSWFDKAYLLVRKIMMRKKRKLIHSLLPKQTNLLDIGCGTGSFLQAMDQSGYHVMGIEPDEQARNLAIDKNFKVFEDVNTLKQYLDQSESLPSKHTRSGNTPPSAKGHFQGITLWHVLEHIPDFTSQLHEAHNLLDHKGILIIAVPMHRSFDAKFYKQHWAAYDLPRHLYHFDRDTLNTATENAGFVFVKSKPLPFDAFYVSLLSENHKGTRPTWTGKLRALIIGLISNALAAITTRPASSEVFVFRKK